MGRELEDEKDGVVDEELGEAEEILDEDEEVEAVE